LTAAPRGAVLLLHGQPGSARDWGGVIDALGQRATVLAIDRPGWDGHSIPADLEGNARSALAALDAAGVERATVAGHSFGAAVAVWLAIRHPGRVGALVLAAPSANVASLYPLDRWLAAPVFGDAASAAALAVAGAALIAAPPRRRIARALSLDEPYLGAAGRRLVAPWAWRTFVHEQRTLVHDLPALERRLPEIAAPTTIVAGTRDRIVPARSVRQLARQIPGARVRWLRGAGHLLPLRRSSELAEIVLAAATPNPASARERQA
jgi:pimeloyl-ACP methyl ester carboxylesterase